LLQLIFLSIHGVLRYTQPPSNLKKSPVHPGTRAALIFLTNITSAGADPVRGRASPGRCRCCPLSLLPSPGLRSDPRPAGWQEAFRRHKSSFWDKFISVSALIHVCCHCS